MGPINSRFELYAPPYKMAFESEDQL